MKTDLILFPFPYHLTWGWWFTMGQIHCKSSLRFFKKQQPSCPSSPCCWLYHDATSTRDKSEEPQIARERLSQWVLIMCVYLPKWNLHSSIRLLTFSLIKKFQAPCLSWSVRHVEQQEKLQAGQRPLRSGQETAKGLCDLRTTDSSHKCLVDRMRLKPPLRR